MADYLEYAVVEIAITGDERGEERITSVDVRGRQRTNDGSRRLILRDRRCGQRDVRRDLVDVRDAQGEAGQWWDSAFYRGVRDADGDGIRILGLVVEDCTGF